ncbi:ThiF family adenylyltransferase [Alicyclobacillus curvatus]|nr:ThiF family adenylyltransferase [Alicyclobacillus curvatus]
MNRLEAEGYHLEIRDSNLLIKHVPYVTAQSTLAYGTLVSELSTNGTVTIRPRNHVVWFVGNYPCDNHGQELNSIIHQRTQMNFGDGLVASCSFSSKPLSGFYENYYDKMASYVRILSGFAKAIDPTITARVYPSHETTIDESVFRYLDAASSRAGISAITAKLRLDKIAIIGLGGTGSYILDLVAKTPVQEIHLYDDDTLYAHNAFRTPGAASIVELEQMPRKVDYLFQKYDSMRRNIFVHPVRIGQTNVEQLRDMSFVFIAIDSGPAKQHIIEGLQLYGVPFIDSGVGIYRTGDSLGGIVRVTTGTSGHSSHIDRRVSFADQDEDEYDWNIQTADLNMLNAAMVVLKWKKLFGFYADRKDEYHSTYTIGRNQMLSGECTE